jgi:hypothetical protein
MTFMRNTLLMTVLSLWLSISTSWRLTAAFSRGAHMLGSMTKKWKMYIMRTCGKINVKLLKDLKYMIYSYKFNLHTCRGIYEKYLKALV